MTNLSDLLPAGAASKQLSFTADGAIASGQTVALQTAGTVKAVGNFAAAVGSAQQYHASRVNLNAAAYDSNANKVLIIYNSDTSGDNGLYGVVGTVSGTSISYGTPVVVESGQFYDITNAVFDSSNNKIVFGYRTGTSSGVKMVVATISGTTVSFGSATSVEAASTENGTAIGYDVASGKIVVVYKAAANNQYVTGVVGTISGTSISFGTPTVIASDNNSIGHAVVYDPVVQKTVVAFKSGDYANAAVSTISGTSISFGSSTVLNNSINVQDAITGAYHSAENKIVFQIEDSSNDAHAIVCSVSGTSVTAESITEIIDNGIYGGAQNSLRPVMQYDPDRKKLVFFYVDKSYKVQALTLSLSGTSITVDGTSEIEGTVNSGTLGVTYDTSADKHIVAHAVGYASAAANTFTPAFTNVSSFLGIADAAISNAASGNITMKGGIAANGLSGLTPNAIYYVQDDGSLNTATSAVNYDIANGSYTQAFSVSSQDTFPTGVAFNPAGTKMFVVGNTGDDVNEYTLSTGFDVSTASFVDSFSVSGQQAAPMSVAFNTDGTKMYIVGETEDTVAQYALSTGFDVSSASYTQAFDISGQETEAQGITFNTDGTKMFIVGDTGNDINEYTLSTGFDVSSASFVDSFSLASQTTQPKEGVFNTDGTELYVLARDNQKVYKYTLTTGFDVSSASYASVEFSVSSQETSPQGLAFSADGSKMYVCGDTGDDVNQYATTSTATNSTTVEAGKAMSTTSINLDYST